MVTKIVLKEKESLAITVLSDLHIDSPWCRYSELKRAIERVNKRFPENRLVLIGDIGDFILPGDMRRFSPSSALRGIADRDAFVMERCEYIAKRLKELGAPIDLIGRGNHEEAVLKHHGIDPTREIARMVGARPGGYAGAVVYVFGKGACRFVLLYHHGAWGGEYAKGYNGAFRWSSQYEGWDVFVYGHNHAPTEDTNERYELSGNGMAFKPRKVTLLNVGSWVKPEQVEGQLTPYHIMRGYTTHPNTLATIIVTIRRSESRGRARYPSYEILKW